MPPLKYIGHHSSPRGAISSPSALRPMEKEPGGVTAMSHSPSTQYSSPLPLEMGRMRVRTPPTQSMSTWRLRSISTLVEGPPANGPGGEAAARAARRPSSMSPVRLRPSIFWKAMIE